MCLQNHKEEAILLRENGYSFGEISKKLNITERQARYLSGHIKLSRELITKKISQHRKTAELNKLEGKKIDEYLLRKTLSKHGAYTSRKIIGVSYSCIKYWAKKYGIELRKASERGKFETCQLCQKKHAVGKKKMEFCNTCVSKIRRLLCKIRAIQYKGGKCNRCERMANRENLASFEFHHEGKKDFNIGSGMNRKWEQTKEEIEKCELLCSNCHRIEHSDYKNDALFSVVIQKLEKYKQQDMKDWIDTNIKSKSLC